MHYIIRALILILFIGSCTLIFAQGEDWYVIDLNGDTVSHIQADQLSKAGEDFIKIERNGKFGLIDYAGRSIVKLQFNKIKGFSNGLACVRHDGRYGFIDTKGRMVVPARYEEASPFSDGVALVKMAGKYGYIDQDGNQVIEFKFSEASIFSEGFAYTRKTYAKTFGMIDKSGEYFLEPTKYQNLFFPKDGLIRARLNNKWGYLNLKGETVIEHQFRYAFSFSEGVAWYSEDGMHYGLIDKTGKTVVDPSYTMVKTQGFSNGLGAAVSDGSWGFINKKGQTIIPFEYEDVRPFVANRAAVKKNGLWGYIDKEGNFLISPRFKEASDVFPVRKRPIMVVKGANYKVPAPKAELIEKEETTEENASTKESTGAKPTLGKSDKEPKEEAKPTLGKSDNGPADPIRAAKQLQVINEKLSKSRLTCTESLVSIKKAHEAGTLDVFAQEAPIAREKLNEAIKSYNEATSLLKNIGKLSESMEDCPSLPVLVSNSSKKASTAGQHLKKASADLDKAVSKEAYDSFTAEVKAYFNGLEATSVSLKALQSELEDCLF